MTGQPDLAVQAAQRSDQDTSQDSSQNFTELNRAVVEVNQLGANVREGKVTLDPAAGAALLAALREHADDVAELQRRAGDLARSLPMGNNPVGTSMGSKFSDRADGHRTALATVLAQYRDALVDAGSAVDQAMRLYESNEAAGGRTFTRIAAD